MKIAQISTCWVRTPPRDGYGGTEWVVSYLTEQLVAAGHDVTLFATGDSITKARLRSGYDAPTSTDEYDLSDEIMHVGRAYECIRETSFDIIHNHTYYLGPALLSISSTPSVTTSHIPLDPAAFPTAFFLHKALSKRHRYVSVSQRQQDLAPQLNWVGTVHNGIDVSDFPFAADKDDYLLFMGRIDTHKAPHLAIQAARALGHRLKIAGPIREQEREYYKKRVAPWVDGRTIEYVGEVNFDQKVALYRNARALLVPLNWEEPFGMVMIEALACGTPVIAFPRGAAPEIVVHGRVGFLTNDVNEMIADIKNIKQISPWACREYVEQHFNARLMAERYLEVYQRIIEDVGGKEHGVRAIQRCN